MNRANELASGPGGSAETPQDPELPATATAGGLDLRALAVLALTSALGICVVAIGYAVSRAGNAGASVLFWGGLLIIVLPIALRLIGEGAGRSERLILVLLLGLALYAIVVLQSPNTFQLHDELGQYRSVSDVLRTQRLFTPNPLVLAYSYYTGIMSLTAALSRLSGLSIFVSGVLVIAVARALLMGGLFLLTEHITRSARIAGIAVLIYVANPNFVFFDSQFAYESAALGLGILACWATSRVADAEEGTWADLAIAVVLVCGLVLTHHLTSYAVAIFIVAWTAMSLVRNRRARSTQRLVLLAVATLAATGAYAVYAYHATASDIGTSVTSSLSGVFHVITGDVGGRKPFTAAAGYSTPILERIAGLVSVVLIIFSLPGALYVAWRRRSFGPGFIILALAASLYPFSLALRLASTGAETSARTSEFVFVGLGATLGLGLVTLLARWGHWPNRSKRTLRVAATVYVGLLFVGGITVGTPTYNLLPGGYEVGAGPRSVDSEGLAATAWAADHLSKTGDFLANSTDTLLFTAYTRLDPEQGDAHGVRVGELFFAPRLLQPELKIITVDKIQYLIVDTRDSRALPRSGSYFENGDPVSSYSQPIAASSLTKFDHYPCIDRLFSSGNILIYGTSRLLGSCR